MYNGLFVNNVDKGLFVYFLKGPSCKGYIKYRYFAWKYSICKTWETKQVIISMYFSNDFKGDYGIYTQLILRVGIKRW